MKKINDKQKKIIAYIIAIWFAIFGTIGMVQTVLNIANCAGRKEQVKKAYAADSAVIDSTIFRFNLGNIYTKSTNTTTKTTTSTNTWIIDKNPSLNPSGQYDIEFKTNNETYKALISYPSGGTIIYSDLDITEKTVYNGNWEDEEYRTIELIENPSENFKNWLANNAKKKETTPTETTIIEQSTQQIEFTFTANTITIQIYNANRETTYIGKWQGTEADGWDNEIGSYNTKPIDGTTILQREGFRLHLSPQNTSILSGQIQPTFIPTQGERTVYQSQIVFKFGLASTTEESEYIQIQVNKEEESIKFIPENTVFQNSLNTTGYTQGYQEGFKQGQQEKEIYGITQYNKGKSDGIASANNYSFKSLITAVFDVPVQTLYGMLNFNILGINILSFVMSIISVILLIAIVKVFL